MDEVRADRVHGAVREPRRDGPGEHRPGLRDRVDPALVALRRAERSAVVVVAAPIPLAVPCPFQAAGEAMGFAAVALAPCRVSSGDAERYEVAQDGVKEEAEPGALAAPRPSDAVHPVVPVTAAHEREAVDARRQPAVERAHAVLEQRAPPPPPPTPHNTPP